MQAPPILELMTGQIASECEAKLSAAREQAAQLRDEARARAAKRRDDLMAAVEAEKAELDRRSKERAEAESEMVLLTTKDTVTDEILGRVKAELTAVANGPQFPAILEQLLTELLPEAPKGGVVLVPAPHEAHCREWLANNGHAGLEVQPRRDLTDGVAVQDKAQTFRVTNTLSTRFEQLEASLRKYCVTELFGEGA